jgi:hypothetical protein
MTATNSDDTLDFTIDKTNLYREEGYTDLKVASIRKLIPIHINGSDDKSRTAIFIGSTQLMSDFGPLPIQAALKANNFQEALDAFPDAMQRAMAETVNKLKEMQEQELARKDSRIIVPGQ